LGRKIEIIILSYIWGEGWLLEFVLSSMVVFSVGLCCWGVFIFCAVLS